MDLIKFYKLEKFTLISFRIISILHSKGIIKFGFKVYYIKVIIYLVSVLIKLKISSKYS